MKFPLQGNTREQLYYPWHVSCENEEKGEWDRKDEKASSGNSWMLMQRGIGLWFQ